MGPLHIHLLLNCVHKYTDIYYGICLLTLQGLVAIHGIYSISISSELCSQIQTFMMTHICWPLWGVVVAEKGVRLHIHLLLNCVHKYTDINDAIHLLALKGVVVVEDQYTPYPPPSFSELCLQIHIYDAMGLVGPYRASGD